MLPIFTRKIIAPKIFEALTYLEADGAKMFLQEHREHLDNWLQQFYPDMVFKSTQYEFDKNPRLTMMVKAIIAETRTIWDINTEPKLLSRVKAIQQMIENLEELWDLLGDQYGLTLPEPTAA